MITPGNALRTCPLTACWLPREGSGAFGAQFFGFWWLHIGKKQVFVMLSSLWKCTCVWLCDQEDQGRKELGRGGQLFGPGTT